MGAGGRGEINMVNFERIRESMRISRWSTLFLTMAITVMGASVAHAQNPAGVDFLIQKSTPDPAPVCYDKATVTVTFNVDLGLPQPNGPEQPLPNVKTQSYTIADADADANITGPSGVVAGGFTATITKDGAGLGKSVTFTSTTGNAGAKFPLTATITYSTAGDKTVTSGGSATYQPDPVNQPNTFQGLTPTQTDSITVHVIGGPITGDTDLDYYCFFGTPRGQLSAAAGQPANVTYSWSMTGTAATLVDPNFPTKTVVTPTATYAGLGPSDPTIGYDVTATLTYSLLGVNCQSTLPIKIHVPTTIQKYLPDPQVKVYLLPDPQAFGFYTTRTYQVLDQFLKPMPSVTVNEKWGTISYPTGADKSFSPPAANGGGANSLGVFTDILAAHYYGRNPPLILTNATVPVEIYAFSDHKWWVGPLGNGTGCGPLLTYLNVQYWTNNIVND